MTEYEHTKNELEKIKVVNKNLRKRLNEQSLSLSDVDEQSRDDEYDNTLGDVSM
jgi:hypothetical protein